MLVYLLVHTSLKPLGPPPESVVVTNESLEVVNNISAVDGVEEIIMAGISVAGRNLGNVCLYLPSRCFHCPGKFSRHVSGILFSMVVRHGQVKKRT